MPDLKSELIKKISLSVSPEAAHIWLDDCSFVGQRNGRIEFETTSEFKRKMLEIRLGKVISNAVNELTENESGICFTVAPGKKAAGTAQEHHSFEDFIRGTGNEFALATVLAATDKPLEKLPHPVYIYGDKNLGKTHLLRSAEKRIPDISPDTKTVYIKAVDLIELFGPPKADWVLIDDFFADDSGKLQLYIRQALNRGTNIIAAGEIPPFEDPDTGSPLLPGTDIVCTPADIQTPDMETMQAINTVTALRKGIVL